MKTVAQQIKQELDAKRAEAREAWGKFDEARKDGLARGIDFSKDKDAFDAAHGLHKTYGTIADEVADLESRLSAALDMDGTKEPAKLDDTTQWAAKSGIWTPGMRLVEAEAYKALVANGELVKSQGVDMPRIQIADVEETKALLAGLHRKALLTGTSDTEAGAFIQAQRVGYYPGLLQPLDVLNLVTLGNTDSDLVEWVQETGFTNAAAEIAEATDILGTGAKPESSLAFSVVQSAVKTIAHWIPATKRALADAGQLRTIVDQRMDDGVRIRLQAQVINGNGAGENLRGILNTVGISTVAKGGAEPSVEAILRGITAVRLAFLEPTAVGLHPNDWMEIRLMKDANGNYQLGSPNFPGVEQVWGLPVTQSAVFPQGTGLVGKFDEAILWTREGVTISATDSHADFFTHNLVAILAEGRWAFGVPRPAAFCSVTGI